MANRNIQAKIVKMKKAYLKRRKFSYDPASPVAMRTRGGNAIDLGSQVVETWEFGRRGLHMGRAVGPTEVAPHVTNDSHRPTMVPKAKCMVEKRALVQYEKTPFGEKFRDFLSQKVFERPDYTIFMWFSGDEFIFEKRMSETPESYRSIVYNREQAKRRQKILSLITWVGKPIRYPSG